MNDFPYSDLPPGVTQVDLENKPMTEEERNEIEKQIESLKEITCEGDQIQEQIDELQSRLDEDN